MENLKHLYSYSEYFWSFPTTLSIWSGGKDIILSKPDPTSTYVKKLVPKERKWQPSIWFLFLISTSSFNSSFLIFSSNPSIHRNLSLSTFIPTPSEFQQWIYSINRWDPLLSCRSTQPQKVYTWTFYFEHNILFYKFHVFFSITSQRIISS